MKKSELINKLKFYMLYLTNCFTSYILCERINDWYVANKELLSKSNLFLSISARALSKDCIDTFYSLFTSSNNDKSLNKLVAEISIQRETTSWLSNKIKEKNLEIRKAIDENVDVIKHLSNWRCDFYAHITPKSFNQALWTKFKEENPIEIEKAMDLVYQCYNCLNLILKELGEPMEAFKYSNLYDIDNLFISYCNTARPKFSVDITRYPEFYNQ